MLDLTNLLRIQIVPVGGRSIVCLDGALQPDLVSLRKVISAELVAKADAIRHPERQREWILSRLLMSHVAGYIPDKGDQGELLWGLGHCGSLTHKKGHVALSFHSYSTGTDDPGIDLELVRDLNPELQLKILNASEIEIAGKIGTGSSTAVFSAKEAIFKCLFRSVGYRFYFEAAELLDVCAAGDRGVMIFRTTVDLGAKVLPMSMIRVDYKQITLGLDDFWLTSARRKI